MNCLSLNVRGVVRGKKAEWIRGIKKQFQVNFISGQETQMRDGNSLKFDCFWEDSPFDAVTVDADRRSGGLFCVWNASMLQVSEVVKDRNFICVCGLWGMQRYKVFFVNVYAPIDNQDRNCLWNRILDLKLSKGDGAWLLMGDFNEVTSTSDRFSEQVCQSSMKAFKNFIRDAEVSEFNFVTSVFRA